MMKNTSFIKASLLIGGMLYFIQSDAQELYVFTEPASNMPARSISAKATARIVKSTMNGNWMQRYAPEIMFGLSKKWMVHGAVSFSDMFSSNLQWESARIYAKYRFLSSDQVHRHFRMAAFGEFSGARNRKIYDEVAVEGDHSGFQAGVVATQLWNKLAVSSSASYLFYTGLKPKTAPQPYPYHAVNYTLSAGYLVLPVHYLSFEQTNLNIYAELLGQRSLDMKRYYLDLAPAIQLIFNSNSKLNLGYRYQLSGNMHRMAERGWLISFERTFLNALK